MVDVAPVMLAGGCAGEPAGDPWSPPGGGSPDDVRWGDQVVVDRDTGEMTAPWFNALVDAAAPGWATSPDTTAAELLDLDRPFDGPVQIHLREEDEDDGAVVTVTLTGLADGSIEAIRYRVELVRADDGRHRFVAGEWSQRRQGWRGHQWFAAGTCS